VSLLWSDPLNANRVAYARPQRSARRMRRRDHLDGTGPRAGHFGVARRCDASAHDRPCCPRARAHRGRRPHVGDLPPLHAAWAAALTRGRTGEATRRGFPDRARHGDWPRTGSSPAEPAAGGGCTGVRTVHARRHRDWPRCPACPFATRWSWWSPPRAPTAPGHGRQPWSSRTGDRRDRSSGDTSRPPLRTATSPRWEGAL
jgi:hypothetical protein